LNILLEDIKVRIEGIQEAIKRSRLSFLVCNVASTSVILAAWNAYFSWYRSQAFAESFAGNPVTLEAQKELLREWVESRDISISLLGIHLGVSDLAFVGSLGLFVVSAWFFYSTRKENHLIGVLLRDTQQEEPDLRRFVYHGVSSYMVFVTMTRYDTPITSLARTEKESTLVFLRPAIRILHYLPAFVIYFLIVMDCVTILWWPPAF